MSTIEVMRKALEALEADDSKLWPSERRREAITALRAELERIEGAEPVAWLRKQRGDYEGPASMAPLLILGRSQVRPHSSLHGATYEPLYTAPIAPAAAEPAALGAPIAPEHDAELAAHAERAEQLHAEFLIAQKTYAYNTPGIARCARMAATPEGRRSLDAGRVSIGLEPIWEPAFATAPIAPAIPALTEEECEMRNRDPHTEWDADMRWAYALAAERAGVRIKEEGK